MAIAVFSQVFLYTHMGGHPHTNPPPPHPQGSNKYSEKIGLLLVTRLLHFTLLLTFMSSYPPPPPPPPLSPSLPPGILRGAIIMMRGVTWCVSGMYSRHSAHITTMAQHRNLRTWTPLYMLDYHGCGKCAWLPVYAHSKA